MRGSSRQSHRPGWVWLALRVVAVLAACGAVQAVGAESEAERLRRLLGDLPHSDATCSASILDLDTGVALAKVNPSAPMLPASAAKVFVIAAAVDLLGPDFAFRTVLARQGPDLVLIGGGDPTLGDVKVARARGVVPEAMFSQWAEALSEQGPSSIPGDLVIDESIFDAEFLHPDWDPGDHKKWYAAPVGALNYNGNCVDVTIRPAARAGDPVLWQAVPPTDLIRIVNRCKSGGKGTPLIDRPRPEFSLVISGRCSKTWPFPPIPAPDPGLLTAGALRSALAQRGVTIAGRIRRDRVRAADGGLPSDCRIVADWVTPLPIVLARTGKNSQNMFAECLMKRLGYEWARRQGHTDPRGTWSNGRAAMNEFLVRVGADPERVTIADGSGLSRSNRCSAADLMAVLRYMHAHPRRKMFVESLSNAGTDGTLQKRLRHLTGRVYAKTGYLRGTRTLAGYAVTPQGRWRAFAVLFNGFKGGAAPYNDIHDRICRILAADPPGDPVGR